jgi:glycosyltransferase involved in cell wall biosynthesis
LRSGFANAQKDLIFYTDGDAQYDPREIANLYAAMNADVDVVNGYKIHRNDPLNRKIIGALYHQVVSRGFGIKLRDVDCDFRLFRREVFDVVHLQSNSGIICVELMKRVQDAGFRIAQVPVHHYHRAFGISQFFNFRRVARTGLDMLGLWYHLVLKGESRQPRPARAPLPERPA